MKQLVLSLNVLCVCLLLAGCGFSPLYGQQAENEYMQHDLNLVEIANTPDREGQFLRNLLIDRFYTHGRPATPKYRLILSNLEESTINLDVTKSSDATRAQLRLDVDLNLIDLENNRSVLKRTVHTIASYNILRSQFTTRVSEEAVRNNALKDLARQIEQDLALYFKRPEQDW